ncbi:hypothetical protein AVEN_14697-1 [Araneus ventricosus]|uniref:Retrovirus-related Pol polyprotein from transposon TNT 1-94 n=1 Tax=Araneus ventricosus TaxID=182803 RepID=A0A4Y2NE19_ARAVE|nr:hypothetical protein AVEN_14697-1 [Araneus ventricosus]
MGFEMGKVADLEWVKNPINERTVASLTERLRLHEQRLESLKLPHESRSVAFVTKPKSACVAVKNDLLQLWMKEWVIKQKVRSKVFEIQKLDSEFCDACMYGKMHRLSFGSRQHRLSSPGQLVHADVYGPIPEKYLGGNRYFVAFKDDYSKYRTVYLMKKKSEVKEILSKFQSEMKNAED